MFKPELKYIRISICFTQIKIKMLENVIKKFLTENKNVKHVYILSEDKICLIDLNNELVADR